VSANDFQMMFRQIAADLVNKKNALKGAQV
jgi:hypothetical protein